MPSLNSYKKMLGSNTNGRVRKLESDLIMEATWDEDIQSKVAYIYDYFHDDEPLLYKGMHPEISKTKVPVDIKYIINGYNSENKDILGKHIQFKPSFDWHNIEGLSYYKESFEDKYAAEFPLGLMLDIYDDGLKQYRKWLITEIANTLDLQFPTWYILPADNLFQWISGNVKYQMCGVPRSQSSYNVGTWQNRGGAIQLTMVENQRICILPINEYSTKLFYDTRVVISVPMEEPLVWKVAKVETNNPKGVIRITFGQDRWNEHSDAFEYENEDGTKEYSSVYDPSRKITGMYADYFKEGITPEESNKEEISNIYGEFTYSGQSQVKIGGSYKKYTVKFYSNGAETSIPITGWEFSIDGTDCSSLVSYIPDGNVLKVKFIGDDTYIEKVMQIKCKTALIDVTIDSIIIGL